jgi:hypothetical protein
MASLLTRMRFGLKDLAGDSLPGRRRHASHDAEAVMHRAGRLTSVMLVLAMLALGGCANTRNVSGPPPGVAATTQVPTTQPEPSAGSPAPTSGGLPSGGPVGSTGAAGKPSQPTGCLAGQLPVSWAEGQAPTNAICVHVGAQVAINLYPPQLHEWTTPSSSDPAVAAVATSGANQEGAMAATVNALHAGTAAVSTVAQAKDGAPDPQPVAWRLVITVIA